MTQTGRRFGPLVPKPLFWAELAIACTLLAGLACVALRAEARPTSARLDPPAAPGLSSPARECPVPLDPGATPEHCAACALADATTGRIPLNDIRMASETLPDGVALRVTAEDPASRELLWRAVVARGELVETLRTGRPDHLCSACQARRELLRDLRIAARRIPAGVELVYTSSQPYVVRQIHAALQATQQFPVRF